MKKFIFLSILSVMLWFSSIAQKTCTIQFNNFVQTNETEFRFDVWITNTSANAATTGAFAINYIQFELVYNPLIVNGGMFVPNGGSEYITGTQLFGAKIVPDAANIGVTTNSTGWVTSTLSVGNNTTVLKATTLKIGTFIYQLKNLDGFSAHNFASVLPMFTLPIGPTNAVGWCPYSGTTQATYKKAAGTTGVATLTVINNLGNKPLYSYCFTGTDNFNAATSWNNYVDPTDASYNVVPSASTNNISIGNLNFYDGAADAGAIDGICTISDTKTMNDLIIGSASTLTMSPLAQVSVNGTIYKGNAAIDAITLKSSAAGTASLKNNTPGITATIERFMPAWTAIAGWHLLSSPVAGQLIAPNFIDPTPANYDFFGYSNDGLVLNTSGQALCWKNQKILANNLTTFAPGIGYLASYATDGTHNFEGVMNVADVSPVVTNFAAPGSGFNLLGNPYACAIDGSLLTRTNLDNLVYVLDGPTNNYLNHNGTVGTFNGEIPSGQGFFVNAIAASPAITIPAAAKKHSSNPYYKSTIANQLHLKVVSPNATSDVTIVYFKNDNSNGLDLNDGLLMPSGNPLNAQIYSYINSDKYCIDALAEFSAPISVNVGFEPKVDGNFTITAGEIQSFSSASTIILQDLKTNTTQNLRVNPTYTFTAATTDAVNRFKLLFDLAPTGINKVNENTTHVYSFENSIYIQSNEKVKSVSVYNMLGQEVENIQQNVSNVYTLHQPSGYYTVRVITDSNVSSQKVYIK